MKGRIELKIYMAVVHDILTKSPKEIANSLKQAIQSLRQLDSEETALAYLEIMLRYISGVGDGLSHKEYHEFGHWQKDILSAFLYGNGCCEHHGIM